MGTIILMDAGWKKDGNPVASPIRVLILDTADDAECMVRELQDAGFAPSWERVDTEEEFLTQLAFAP